MKKKLLIFHPALAPYRIDYFNHLSSLYELKVVFLYENLWNHKFNQSQLVQKLTFEYQYLTKGLAYKGWTLRFGMLKVIKTWQPDYVLGYEYSFTTQYLVLLKRIGLLKGIALGSTIDDNLQMCRTVQSRLRKLARQLSIKHLDYLIVLSKQVASFYCDNLGFDSNKIIVSPFLQDPQKLKVNASNLNNIASSYRDNFNLHGKKALLFVGRFIPEKGLELFLDNIHDLIKEKDDIVIILVGDGILKDKVKQKALDLHLNNKIIMPGRFEGDNLLAWYKCASGFFLPSVSEPFGAVVDEALIFGLQTLCSSIAGASTLINDKNGIVFDPNDCQETRSKFSIFIERLVEVDFVNHDVSLVDCGDSFEVEWRKLL